MYLSSNSSISNSESHQRVNKKANVPFVVCKNIAMAIQPSEDDKDVRVADRPIIVKNAIILWENIFHSPDQVRLIAAGY